MHLLWASWSCNVCRTMLSKSYCRQHNEPMPKQPSHCYTSSISSSLQVCSSSTSVYVSSRSHQPRDSVHSLHSLTNFVHRGCRHAACAISNSQPKTILVSPSLTILKSLHQTFLLELANTHELYHCKCLWSCDVDCNGNMFCVHNTQLVTQKNATKCYFWFATFRQLRQRTIVNL